MSTRAELAAVEPSDEQMATRVWRHPYRETIHALLLRGRPADWIERWLDKQYPVALDDGSDHPDATENARMRINARTLERYRLNYFPETGEVVDGIIPERLQELVGRRLPAPVGVPWELDVIEQVGIPAAMKNLERALASDDEMDMLNPTTMDAQGRLMETLGRSVEIKSRLGLKGYEAAPDRQHIVSENSNFSVELSGKLDQATGRTGPVDEDKLELARKLLSAPQEERDAIIAAANENAALQLAAMPVEEAITVEAIEEPDEPDS